MKHNNQINTIIFDLFGVLFKFDTIPAIRYLGVGDIIWYYLRFRQDPFQRSLRILDKIRREVPGEYQTVMKYKDMYLPESFVKWQKGYIKRIDLVHLVHQYLHQLSEEHYFVNHKDQKAIEKLLTLFAHPRQMLSSFYLPIYIVDLIKKIKATNHYKLLIISNIDEETYHHVIKEYDYFFSLFDGFIASCNVHLVKPESAIYQYALDAYQVNPGHTLFVDDQRENIVAAHNLGINTHMCPSPKKLAHILKSIGIQ